MQLQIYEKETKHMENETRKIEMDGNALFHRKNADGTVTLYAEGIF